MNNSKISVIIPTFNRAKLISRAVRSVLKQTYSNIEIIVVDDGSSDNTEKVINSIKDNRIKYIKLENNEGACFARNVGIKAATGDYISFQDSDDVYCIDKLEKQYKNMMLNGSDLDFCKVKIKDKNVFSVYPDEEQIESLKNNSYVDELCKNNYISTQSILVKRAIIQKILFDDNLPRLQDYDLALRLLPKCKISFTNEILVKLYRQSDSIGANSEKLKVAIDVICNKIYEITFEQEMQLIDTMNRYYLFYVNSLDIDLESKNYILAEELKKYRCEFYKIQKSKTWILKNKFDLIFRRYNKK